MSRELVREDAAHALSRTTVDLGRLSGRDVLVTGATGLVGRHVVELLLALGDRGPERVTIVTRDPARAATAFGDAIDRLDVITGDVGSLDTDRLESNLVIHAASPATPSDFAKSPVGVIRSNVHGTERLLELCRRTGGYLAFVSTMEIYGIVPRPSDSDDVTLAEDDYGAVDPMDPRSAYPESKRLGESLLVAHAREFGVRSDSIRLTHTYGAGASASDDRVQVQFARAAAAGEPIVLKSDGSMRRTYTYATDAAMAILCVAATAADRTEPEAFNVADQDCKVSIRELAEAMLVGADRPATDLQFDIDPDAMWSKVPGGTYVDTTRIRSLGWRPAFDLATGARRIVAHERP